MGQQTEKVDIDPEDMESARHMWEAFTKLVIYSSSLTAAVLILMLIFLY